MQVLAFSSSRLGKSTYLETVVPEVINSLGNKSYKVAFIPFASVGSYNDYRQMVADAFASTEYQIQVVLPETAFEQIENADIIMVGGGNTFKLLHHLYHYNVLELIKSKVRSGTPYVGWSAGSNITGLSICTTNDMPILEPQSFKAFSFFPFQINPHYINIILEGHNGETRDQRLTEFAVVNRQVPVVCLPEGTALSFNAGKLLYKGDFTGMILSADADGNVTKKEVQPGTDLTY
ncbi:dipeptidase PepE [Aridibaculum aurantiacum]|uniref:dipeptidase PepE n=1 Tax=Aridibaculum aurantiacum TaxID=2810307 RepID=UPI001A95A0FA|nr:dipeptidase PepE [Aridibaculum aurantiacum]